MKKITYRIEQDTDANNPRNEFDHISTFYGPKQGHYLVGGKQDVEMYDYDLEDKIQELRKEKAIIIEFQANAGTCYAVVERDQLDDEYLKHGYSMRKALYHARKCAQGEINEWLAWCNGEVYGYIVEYENGEHLDSCWGFYGYEYAKEEAESSVKYFQEQAEQEEKKLEERIQMAATL